MRANPFTPAIKLWKPRGALYIWTYPYYRQSMSGWHFWAAKETCASLIELCDIMLEAPEHAKIQMPLTPPTWDVLRHANPTFEWKTTEMWFLRLLPEEKPDYWSLEMEGKTLRHSMGKDKIVDLRNAFREVIVGKNDFALGPRERIRWNKECLRFWD